MTHGKTNRVVCVTTEDFYSGGGIEARINQSQACGIFALTNRYVR